MNESLRKTFLAGAFSGALNRLVRKAELGLRSDEMLEPTDTSHRQEYSAPPQSPPVKKTASNEPPVTEIPAMKLPGKIMSFSRDYEDPDLAGRRFLIISKMPGLIPKGKAGPVDGEPAYKMLELGKKSAFANAGHWQFKSGGNTDFHRSLRNVPIMMGGNELPAAMNMLLTDGFPDADQDVGYFAKKKGRIADKLTVVTRKDTMAHIFRHGRGEADMLIFQGITQYTEADLCGFLRTQGCYVTEATPELVFSKASGAALETAMADDAHPIPTSTLQ